MEGFVVADELLVFDSRKRKKRKRDRQKGEMKKGMNELNVAKKENATTQQKKWNKYI